MERCLSRRGTNVCFAKNKEIGLTFIRPYSRRGPQGNPQKVCRRVCWWHWKLGRRSVKGKMTRTQHYSPSSDPHTRGMISNMAEQDASSKQSWRASRHLRMATAVFTFGPKKRKILCSGKWAKMGRLHIIRTYKQILVLLGCYAAQIGCPETSENNYQSPLRNNPEEQSFHLHRGRSLNVRK